MKNRNRNKRLNVSIDEMIEALVVNDIEMFEWSPGDLEEMLTSGWKGWANYPEDEIKEEYELLLENSLA